MYKSFFFIVIVLTFRIISYAQHSKTPLFFIRGNINSKELTNIEFEKLGMNEYMSKNIHFQFPVSSNKHFSGSYPLSEKGMYRINDGFFGHRIFITPGDSVEIEFKKIKREIDKKGVVVFIPTFHKIIIKGKYPGNYTYFDDIEIFFGYTVKAYKTNIQPALFKRKCDSAYNAAFLLLSKYSKKKLVSDTFVRYAQAELEANYIMWLCTPLALIEKSKLPENYFEKIRNVHFDNNDFLTRTAYYVTGASVYNTYVLNNFNPEKWYSNLDNEFYSASTYYKGMLKERLMGWLLTDYKDKGFKSYDSLYQYFLNDCKTVRIKNEVIKNIEAYKLLEKSKPPFLSLLKNTILTKADKTTISFDQINTTKKWILIDCWATWCMPCRKQLPYLQIFEKKYKEEIEFVFFSFDEQKKDWKELITKNAFNMKNQYIVTDAFKSEFAKYFDIITIPRYILLNNENNIITISNKDMPLPIQAKSFESAIVAAIRK